MARRSTSLGLNTKGGRIFKMLPAGPHSEVRTWCSRMASMKSTACS